MTPKIFFCKKLKKISKNAKFTLISNPLKKLQQNAPKKVTIKTSLTNMCKSEKVHISVKFLLITFLGFIFSKLFSADLKSAWNSAFFDTHIEFFNKKIVFALISFFCTLWLQMRRKRQKKTENLFLWMCLRILLGNHQRVCITKLLKSLYPNIHMVRSR